MDLKIMIRFSEESLQAVDHAGNPVLANGDALNEQLRLSPRIFRGKPVALTTVFVDTRLWKTKGAFHSTKNSGLNFRNFRMWNGTVFSTRPDRSSSIPA